MKYNHHFITMEVYSNKPDLILVTCVQLSLSTLQFGSIFGICYVWHGDNTVG